MKHFLIGITLLWSVCAFAGEQVFISIAVQQKSLQTPSGKPFMSVGLFQVVRGDKIFEQGSCPDYSDREGKLGCVISCNGTEKMGKPLRIVPPGSGLQIKGFVVPPAADIVVVGCSVKPAGPKEFVYIDSRMALNDLFKAEPALTQLVSVGDGGRVTFESPAKVIATYGTVGKEPGGIEKLLELQRFAAIAAEAHQSSGDQPEAKQFAEFSIGVSNYVLREIAKSIAGVPSMQIRESGDTKVYYKNLGVIEVGLGKKMGRSPWENQLLNTIEVLKTEHPYSAVNQAPLKEHLQNARIRGIDG